MSNASHARRAAIALVAMLALSTASLAPVYAQPIPASSPAPATAPAPGTFHSPFGGNKPSNSVEGKDFGLLMSAYDAMLDASAALQSAINCRGNVTAAIAALNAATAAFNTAMAQYAFDWSSYTYGGVGIPLAGQVAGKFSQARMESTPFYNDTDKPAIMAALAAQDARPHPVPGCPAAPTQTGLRPLLGGFALGLATGVLAFGHADRDDFVHGHAMNAGRDRTTDAAASKGPG